MAYDCSAEFDRCSKGKCLNDAKVDQYRVAASKAYEEAFGAQSQEVSFGARKCVTESQCIAGDICHMGACQSYGEAH